MEIYIAPSAGFCFGVKRAISIAYKAIEEDFSPIFSLGDIIHNPQMVKRMEEMGLKSIASVDEIDEGRVIIRSHGITYPELKKAQDKGLKIIDATCPFVKRVQEYTSLFSREGYFVVVVGDEDHPEVKSIMSYGYPGRIAIADENLLNKFTKKDRVGIVAQTTQSPERVKEVVLKLIGKVKELRYMNTLCNATLINQQNSCRIASNVDCMIVVGGYNSANTKRIAQMCHEINPKTYHVEIADELRMEWFYNAKSVGITAGASTPDWVINEVVERIKSFGDTVIIQ